MFSASGLVFRLALLTFCVFGFANAYFLLASLLESQGFSPAITGLLVSVFYGTTLLARPLAGSCIERRGVRVTLFLAGGSTLLGGAGLLVLSSAPGIFCCRVVAGLGFSLGTVALAAYQGMAIPPELRGRSFALTTIGSITTMIFVVPLGEGLMRSGCPLGYLALPPLLALATLALGSSLPPLNATQLPPAWGTWRELLGNREYCWILGCAFCFSLADASVLFLSTLVNGAGLSASPFMAATAGGAVLARTLGLRAMTPRLRPRIAPAAAGLMGIAVGLLPLADTALLLILFGVLFGVGVGFAYPVNLALVGDRLPPALGPKGTAGLLLAMDLCWMVVPLLLGAATPWLGLPRAYVLFSLFIVAGAVLLSLPLRKTNVVDPTR